MQKQIFGRQFKRDTNERKALFKSLLTSLVIYDRIRTTEAKAKSIKSAADKLVTIAKKGQRDAYRGLEAKIRHDAVLKLIADIAPRFSDRPGGYTRIIKTGKRVTDGASMVVMEWSVAGSPKTQSVKSEVSKKESKDDNKVAVKKIKEIKSKGSQQKTVARKIVSRQKKG